MKGKVAELGNFFPFDAGLFLPPFANFRQKEVFHYVPKTQTHARCLG
jgi:hypothetical protein